MDPDAIRESPAYGHGSIEMFSLKKLMKSTEYLKDWEARLKRVRRGTFTMRFVDSSQGLEWSRPDKLVQANLRSVFQVVGHADFDSGMFEYLGDYHYSMYSMIPAAAMAVRLADLREELDLRNEKGQEEHDWSHKYYKKACKARNGTIKFNKQELEQGALDRLTQDLEKTERIISWSKLPRSFDITMKNGKKYLRDTYDKNNNTFDLIFTSAFGRHH